jgi:integrase
MSSSPGLTKAGFNKPIPIQCTRRERTIVDGRVEVVEKKACEEAKIVGLRFHDLRHTAATRLADAGAEVFTIASILGDADLRMTARYIHIRP